MNRSGIVTIPILLTLVVPILVVGCTSSSIFIEPEDDIPATLFKSGGIFHHDADPIQVVIRTPAEWKAFLLDYPIRSLEFARNRFWHVDYARHMVVGVTLGTRGSGSISVNIDSMRIESDRMRVYATEYHPAIQRRDLANPAHFVVIDRIDSPVDFAAIAIKKEAHRPRRH